MRKSAAYLIRVFVITMLFSSPAHTQNTGNADAPAAVSQTQNKPQSSGFEDISGMSIPLLQLRPFDPISTPQLPPFNPIASVALPLFAEIPTAEPKFTAFGATAKTRPIASLPSLPPLKIATPSGKFFEASGEGGGKTPPPANVSSTPTPSPLQPFVWGQPSTPVASPQTPNRQTPYTWGQSSTPIASPLPLQPQTPNRQTPYTWGQSSTPISNSLPLQPLTPNSQTPYIWGQSSTPIATRQPSPSLGQSSTPRGQSSTPHGESSTPHGESSTPRSSR